MPRRNDRDKRSDPRELDFWRARNCTDDDPCYSRKVKPKKGKKKGKRVNGTGD